MPELNIHIPDTPSRSDRTSRVYPAEAPAGDMPAALVAGGGLAGAAVAILLAEAGRPVTLLEKSRSAHHKVCGEFLSAEALHYLRRLGVDPCVLGAKPIRILRLIHKRRLTEHPLPFAAMSLTRRALDEALLSRAAGAGATVLRGMSVDSLTVADGLWTATTSCGRQYRAPQAFAATGKHDLRGHARTAANANSLTRHDGLLAFKMYFRLSTAQAEQLHEAIEVYLFRDGYAGLQVVEDGTANLSLLVKRERFQALGHAWHNLLADLCADLPQLALRLGTAEETLPKPLALSHIPYGFCRATTQPGLWSLGDQAAVIPSFSGDGMSIALHSAFTAAQGMLNGTMAEPFQRTLARQMRTPVRLATLISRMLVGAPQLTAGLPLLPGVLRQVALRTRVSSLCD